MMNSRLLILANAPAALVRLCGITMLDRLLRSFQRAGFEKATVLTTTPAAIETELAKPSWARAQIHTELRVLNGATLTLRDIIGSDNPSDTVLICADTYFDARLISVLIKCEESTALIDSEALAQDLRAFFCKKEFLQSQSRDANVFDSVAKLAQLDVAALPTFVVSMRRHIRPLWFRVPEKSGEVRILDAAQKGTMEMVSYLETPVENWLLRRIWNTSITPLQVTFFGLVVAVLVTVAFVTGHLWIGALLALSVGVIDGVDGKLARVKVETTKLGGWEAELDYPIQMSWWIGLAYYFNRTITGSHAIAWIAIFIASDLIDKLFTRAVKMKTGRYIDNYARIDRFFRFFVGSRSLYVSLFVLGLLLGQPYRAFVIICCWHLAMTIIHGIRAAWICATFSGTAENYALEPRKVATGGNSAARRAGT